jgi:hypothetical protein
VRPSDGLTRSIRFRDILRRGRIVIIGGVTLSGGTIVQGN